MSPRETITQALVDFSASVQKPDAMLDAPDQSEVILAALHTHGWAVVPIEPTEEMCGEGARASGVRSSWILMVEQALKDGG